MYYVKMPTSVDILTLIGMINTISGNLKEGTVFIFKHFSSYKQLKFHSWNPTPLTKISGSAHDSLMISDGDNLIIYGKISLALAYSRYPVR